MAVQAENPVTWPGGPGQRHVGDDLAPVFRLEVNEIQLLPDINQFIRSVEYESAIGMADMLRVIIDNPGLVDDQFPDWSAHKAFQPGNQAGLFLGYGRADRPENFVGRVQWAKHMPQYPREGMPQLEVKGYDLSHLMMDNTGIIRTKGGITNLERKRPVDAADNQGQVFVNMRHSEVVEFIADMYDLDKDIDATSRQENVVLKKGMKHYEIVKGLGNLNNREFWVDYNYNKRKWVLHWKKIQRDELRPGFTFRYNQGDAGTILEANPEYGLRETINEASILVFDETNQRWVSAIEIKEAGSENPQYLQGAGLETRTTPSKSSKASIKKKRSKAEARHQSERRKNKDVIQEAIDNPGAFRIAAAGFAIDVLPPPGRRFRDAEEAGRWLLRWFQMKQDNFITVNGTLIGVESLRARQTHTLRGLGQTLDGDYYFTKVRHITDGDSEYHVEFTANRVING